MKTPRQHFMAFYNNEPMERFPNFMNDVNMLFEITGMNERPTVAGKDWFGCDWVFDEDAGSTVIDISKPYVLEDIEEWKDVLDFPDLDALDWEANAKADGVDHFDPDKANYFIIHQGFFERLNSLMGFEESMCAMITNPEDVAELFDAILEMKLKTLEILAKYYHIDVVSYMDDWGTQRDLFFSPDIWRGLIKPRTKILVDRCHELGMKFELHSCGKITRLIPEIAELGVDALQCQCINEIPEMQKIVGDKMGFSVTPRYQVFAAMDTVGELTRENLVSMMKEDIYANTVNGRYTPVFWPESAWWGAVVHEEMERLGKEIFTQLSHKE